ncbi:hypothetical protein CSW98_05600 [Vibrio sp. HA2012]|uniref:hypothetical protein n=1 Tax=Vibrio sp. HA2012 TaxID=1971595 RepID=UPI000C2BC279|nr:hypothetical protein [Vibrio sp. HA2012]PJC87372.1 hypothetical protein CSW98_05600 [Vibrio sp. HA2012]
MKLYNKITTVAVTALISFSSYAAIPTFEGNQGIRVNIADFNPESLYGQWNLSSGKGFSANWFKSEFFTISYANMNYFRQTALKMAEQNASRVDTQMMWDNESKIDDSLGWYAKDVYGTAEEHSGLRDHEITRKIIRNNRAYINDFIKLHDQRSFLINGYSSLGGAILSQPYVLYKFHPERKRRHDAQPQFEKILDNLAKNKPNFDLFNSVDLHLIVTDVLYGLDIVDNDTIIIYEFTDSNNVEPVVLKRIPKNEEHEVKGYKEILNSKEQVNLLDFLKLPCSNTMQLSFS